MRYCNIISKFSVNLLRWWSVSLLGVLFTSPLAEGRSWNRTEKREKILMKDQWKPPSTSGCFGAGMVLRFVELGCGNWTFSPLGWAVIRWWLPCKETWASKTELSSAEAIPKITNSWEPSYSCTSNSWGKSFIPGGKSGVTQQPLRCISVCL